MRLGHALAFSVLTIFMPNLLSAETANGLITVTGRGDVAVVPDMATIRMGVFETADTAKDAVDGMSEKLAAVLETIREAGIDPTDVQTSDLNVRAMTEYNNSTRRETITGYAASSSVSVRVMELDDLGSILGAVLGDGANQLSGLQFNSSARADHLMTARRLAVADAMAKAKIYADAAGVSLGELVSLSEGGARSPGPIALERSVVLSDAVPIATGDISVSSSVTMTYAIATPQ